jgi:hypothetical protein
LNLLLFLDCQFCLGIAARFTKNSSGPAQLRALRRESLDYRRLMAPNAKSREWAVGNREYKRRNAVNQAVAPKNLEARFSSSTPDSPRYFLS